MRTIQKAGEGKIDVTLLVLLCDLVDLIHKYDKCKFKTIFTFLISSLIK